MPGIYQRGGSGHSGTDADRSGGIFLDHVFLKLIWGSVGYVGTIYWKRRALYRGDFTVVDPVDRGVLNEIQCARSVSMTCMAFRRLVSFSDCFLWRCRILGW